MLSAFALIATTGPAHADSIPRYDPAQYCKKVSLAGGGSQMIYNGCVEMEQNAYDELKSIWDNLPIQAKSYCDMVARTTDGSYSILKGCIDMETEASSSTPKFKF
ncbi:hypothetical protein CO660_00205 [Rhizobium sp. L9]|nr:hypothetical protein CO660_00205 [Rhizobium sp. L9]